jgi:hypothetical protein
LQCPPQFRIISSGNGISVDLLNRSSTIT